MVPKPPPSSLFALVLGLVWLLFLAKGSQAQASSPAQAKTDPAEVKALYSIFSKWQLSETSPWNTIGDPCNGTATDSTSIESSDTAVKCNCSYQNGTTCHIIQLKVFNTENVEGPILEELQNLTYLSYLNLAQNHLTGPLPAFFGNFTSMKHFQIDGNNFTGTLPHELGNMISSEKWYINSSGLSGEIPSSLSKLMNMKIFSAFDNNFTGKIPDFIGTWTNLTELRLQGNSFQGPVPASLANLIKLTDLRIGDILNGGSSLDFTKNMKSLSTLILRNSKISDTVPSNFGEFTDLVLLDLSFNNLTGQLPVSLFNLSLLKYLFLGNNRLSGNLPMTKSRSLVNIDLSYNELSGRFPSWITDKDLQLNLVANNFTINSSDSLPSELICLQRNFPCKRDSLSNEAFGINCGGSVIVSASNGIQYEIDDKSLSTASYYVTTSKKWGVSSIGVFVDDPDNLYTWNQPTPFTNTLNSVLFQDGRLSPSSLRYYGLGLVNGNYNINLHFTEPKFTNQRAGKGHGRRIFDIYIQGVLKEKDFDIEKEANGISYRAVTKEYKALVVDNFLEIHLFWAGKGTCCIPNPGIYGPAIAAISVSSNDSTSTTTSWKTETSISGKKNTSLVVGTTASIAVFIIIFAVGIFAWRERRRRSGRDDDEVTELLGISSRAGIFSFAELRTATEGFDPTNKLGEGGFGPVFKGKLSDGRLVAVKQLSVESHQGKRQFMTEVATISTVHHRNLVNLYGCCFEGDKRLLVYEYMENKSLDQALFGTGMLVLDWPTRFEICLGIARGLAYLHEESRLCIIHRDVKASNILLDSDLNPKISDFGLARLYDDKKTHISTRVAGTIGYLAPEYAMRGHLTEKVDVFGFGVVALEILCGRPNSDTSLPQDQMYLLEWAWHLHENKRELEMVDPTLSSYSEEEAHRVIGVSLLCTQTTPTLRPTMSRVVAMLTGDTKVDDATSRPGLLTDWQWNDLKTSLVINDNLSTPPTVASWSSQVNISSNECSEISFAALPETSKSISHEVIRDGH